MKAYSLLMPGYLANAAMQAKTSAASGAAPGAATRRLREKYMKCSSPSCTARRGSSQRQRSNLRSFRCQSCRCRVSSHGPPLCDFCAQHMVKPCLFFDCRNRIVVLQRYNGRLASGVGSSSNGSDSSSRAAMEGQSAGYVSSTVKFPRHRD